MTPKQVFVREATGLVRQLSPFDAFINNWGAQGAPALQAAWISWFLWYAVPGIDDIGIILLVAVFTVVGHATAWSLLVACFPRSGGPYVAQSRVLHPSVAFSSEIWMFFSQASLLIWLVMITVVFYAWLPGFYILGTLTGNPTLLAFADALQVQWISAVLSTVVGLVVMAIAIMGARYIIPLQKFFFVVGFVIGTLGILIGLVLAQPGDFVATFNAHMLAVNPNIANGYDWVVATAKNTYNVPLEPRLSFPLLLAGLGVGANATNTIWLAYFSGEIKRGTEVKNQLFGTLGAALFAAFGIVVILALERIVVGYDFLVALSQLVTLNPELVPPIVRYVGGVSWYVIFAVSPSPWWTIFLLVTVTCMGFAIFLPLWMMLTRLLFAFSFDRMLPTFIADVNDRWHTPVKSIVICFVIGEIFMLLTIYAPWTLGPLMVTTWAMAAVSQMVTSLAAGLLPMRLRKTFLASPISRFKIGPIPLVGIAGIIGFLFYANAVVQYMSIPAIGVNTPNTIATFIAIYVLFFVIYWVIRYVQRRRGIDLDLVFKELPPE